MEIKTFNNSLLQGMLQDSSASKADSFKSVMTAQSEKKPASTKIDWSSDGKIVNNLATFNGSVEDYDIYVGKDANGKAELSISRRGNNGFPGANGGTVPASEKIKIGLGVDLQFEGRTDGKDFGPGWSQISGDYLKQFADGMLAGQNSRISLSGVYSETSTLYRANAQQIDTIFAGRGDDQFRIGSEGITSSSGYADYFDGGDGRDTVYLPGNSDRYKVSYFSPIESGELRILDTVTGGSMIVKDVERLRFSGATANGGYVTTAEMLKANPDLK